MSAYIVDKNHIRYLVYAAKSKRILGYDSEFRSFHAGEWRSLSPIDPERAAEVGNMLWMENIKSVSARYPGESSATLPGLNDEENFVLSADDFYGNAGPWAGFDPVHIFKACDCYDYQSCEHSTWEESESYAFIQALRRAAWHALPGYSDANWGAPPTLAEQRKQYRATA